MIILYGLLGLGLIIFIHELGHFLVARVCGVEVESFSIGMGPVLLHKTIGKTDYRLSLIPLGGYCGMKGEKAFQEALDKKLDSIPKEDNSFYGVTTWKRILIAFAGPAFNFLFAIIAFTLIAMVGTSYYSTPNKIILQTEVYSDVTSPAEEAGLKTGDIILSINEKETPYFANITEIVSTRPREKLTYTIDRNGKILHFDLSSELNPETGAGRIGIMSWIEPVIGSVLDGSNASIAGLQTGDRIVNVEDYQIQNTMDFTKTVQNRDTINIEYLRDGITKKTELIIGKTSEGLQDLNSLGIQWQVEKIQKAPYSFFPAIGQGLKETTQLLGMTVKSLGLLFSGIDLTKAVSGPIGITLMLGETTQQSFSVGFLVGLVNVLNFLALISISLFLMNLLPIPILDGGIILFALIEILNRKPVKPSTLYKVQFIGFAFILFLFIIGFIGDIRRIFTGGF